MPTSNSVNQWFTNSATIWPQRGHCMLARLSKKQIDLSEVALPHDVVRPVVGIPIFIGFAISLSLAIAWVTSPLRQFWDGQADLQNNRCPHPTQSINNSLTQQLSQADVPSSDAHISLSHSVIHQLSNYLTAARSLYVSSFIKKVNRPQRGRSASLSRTNHSLQFPYSSDLRFS